MTFPPKVWDGVLRRLGEDMPAFAVDSWLRPLVPTCVEDIASADSPCVVLLCPTAFHRDRIHSHFLTPLRDGFASELGRSVRLETELAPASKSTPSATAPTGSAQPSRARALRTVRGSRTAAAKPQPRSIADALAPIEKQLHQQPPLQSESPERQQARAAIENPPRHQVPSRQSHAPTPRAPAPQRDLGSQRPALAVPQASGPRRNEPQRVARGQALQQRFENFVVGPCNQLGRAAALSLSRAQSDSLNQLYLASGPGLGKTHLARAVASESARSGARVRYCSAESFTNDFTAALSSHEMAGFKRRYRRECNVLIIEDVGFFDSKAKTQLEFFHTVQHILDAGGRVVLTGSSLPRDLRGLDDPVRGLLANGFVAELDAPDAEVRRDILRAKAAAGGVRLPAPCLDLLISEVDGSIRELEGVLIQLVTTASLLGRSIDLDLTREAVEKKRGLSRDRTRPRPHPDLVIRTVSSFFKTSPELLSSRSRRRDVLVPRQLAMYLCRKYTDASLGEIGRAMGRDHPSVKNAVERVERQMLERAPVRYQVEALCERLDALLRAEPS